MNSWNALTHIGKKYIFKGNNSFFSRLLGISYFGCNSDKTDTDFVNESEKNKSEQKENLESSKQDDKLESKLKNKPGKVYKRSEETRLKISKALKGKPPNSKSYWLGKEEKIIHFINMVKVKLVIMSRKNTKRGFKV